MIKQGQWFCIDGESFLLEKIDTENNLAHARSVLTQQNKTFRLDLVANTLPVLPPEVLASQITSAITYLGDYNAENIVKSLQDLRKIVQNIP